MTNSLSEQQIDDYREILRAVNLADLCRQNGLNRRVIYAVLDGESSRIGEVDAAVAIARDVIAKRKQNVRSIPRRRPAQEAR